MELPGSLRACWRLAERVPSSASSVLLPWDFYPLVFREMTSPLQLLSAQRGGKGAGFAPSFSSVNLYYSMCINAHSSLPVTSPAPNLSFRAYAAFWYPGWCCVVIVGQ